MGIIVIPMILSSFRKSKQKTPSPQTHKILKTYNKQPLSNTRHIGNMSDFFKNPGGACGSCGRGRK